MALLKIISGDSSGYTLPVSGSNQRIGRADSNDLCLPDGSVSGSHCEISIDSGGNLLVLDLGSTNGTFVEGQRVSKALVQPGQRLRLGNIEMLFESNPAPLPPVPLNLPPPPVAAPPPVARVVAAPVATAPVAASDQCRNHPGVAAVAICNKCGAKSCASCTRQQKVGRNIIHFCGACGGQCRTVAEIQKAAAVEATRTKTFGAGVKRAFAYPFRGNGIFLLIGGTIFFGFLDWLTSGGRGIGIFSFAVQVILWGYLFAVMQRIVVSSATGEEDPPDFPEVSDIHSDIITPFIQLLVTSIVSYGPGVVITVIAVVNQNIAAVNGGSGSSADFLLILGKLATFAGGVYFPMALLGVAMSDSYAALNPAFVFASIARTKRDYIVTCVVFTVLGLFPEFFQGWVNAIDIPLVPHLLYWFFFMAIMVVSMRILGMFYYINRHRLGWGL